MVAGGFNFMVARREVGFSYMVAGGGVRRRAVRRH
jgi:hypothetical protein